MINLLAEIPGDLPQELCQTLVACSALRIERIVSQGHHSPKDFWYDQAQSEWLLLLKGRARVQLQGEPAVELNVGDTLLLPAHTRHRVQWTDPNETTVWLAIYYTDSDHRQSQQQE